MSRIPAKRQAAVGSPDDVEAAFYECLRNGDLDKLMDCWADEDDIACIHPGSVRLLGAPAIRAAFESLFSNGGTIPVSAVQIRRVDSVSSAVHHVLERVDLQTPQGTAHGYVLATNVYHKTPQGWRLVVHHASPGTSAGVQEMGEAPQVLH